MSAAGHGESHRSHMDAIYRYQRYVYDATRKYYLLGRDRLITDLHPPPGGAILEIGCGTGRNLIQAAQRYPDTRCFGFDISSEMLKTARANIAKAGLEGRVTVAEGDATNFDCMALFGRQDFERVFISYALSMIPPWRAVPASALKAVAPGGRLMIVDFGQQDGWPGWFKAGLFAWLRQFTVEPRADLEQVLAEAAKAGHADLTFTRLYRGYADFAVLEKRK